MATMTKADLVSTLLTRKGAFSVRLLRKPIRV